MVAHSSQIDSKLDTINSLRREIASLEGSSASFCLRDAEGKKGLSSASASSGIDDVAVFCRCKSARADGHDVTLQGGVQSDSARRKCRARLENLCSYGEYSQKKMRDRLKREKFPDSDIDDAISFAVRCNIINDVRYGEILIHTRMRAGKGMYGIREELLSHGISPSSIDGWPADFADRYGSEEQRALRLLEDNPPRSKNPRQSAYRRLVTKGYEASIAIHAVSLWEKRSACADTVES